MKAPPVKDLQKITAESTFMKKAEEKKTASKVMIKRTFSIEQWMLDELNSLALEIGNERGIPAGASEAFRVVMRRHADSRK